MFEFELFDDKTEIRKSAPNIGISDGILVTNLPDLNTFFSNYDRVDYPAVVDGYTNFFTKHKTDLRKALLEGKRIDNFQFTIFKDTPIMEKGTFFDYELEPDLNYKTLDIKTVFDIELIIRKTENTLTYIIDNNLVSQYNNTVSKVSQDNIKASQIKNLLKDNYNIFKEMEKLKNE